MIDVGKTVYTVNAKTNALDEWICVGEFWGTFRGKRERLCILRQGKKQVVLPKRCVFLTKEDARKVADSGK